MDDDGAGNNSRQSLIQKFCELSGVDESRAKFYLESSAWEFEIALEHFYESYDSAEDTNQSTNTAAPRTFGQINVETESDEEGQEFYVGGSETSGQQVVGPGRKKKTVNSIVDSIFKSAKEHGAEELQEDSPTHMQSAAFGGTGHRLGDTDRPSDVIQAAASASSHGSNSQAFVLKLWRNGFSVDDGPLRDYHQPDNAAFLNSVRRHEVPPELISQAKGRQVDLNMEDHHDEDYIIKPKKMAAFSGQGFMLGSPAPTVTSPPKPKTPETVAAALNVDNSQPITSIQIRLADGTRLVSKFNHSHLVADVRRFIMASRPEYNSRSFTLQTTFPNKELTDDKQTLEEAKLLNAVIVQRLI